MGKKLEFAAVVSNYNGAAFLGEAIESVLAQDCPATAVLVADDGSSDGSRAVAARYGQVRWISIPHQGQALALAAALAEVHADWVAFLESDDLWRPEKLSRVQDAIGAHPDWIAVQHEMRQVDSSLRPLPTCQSDRLREWALGDFLAGDTLLTGLSALTARSDVLKSLTPLPADLVTCVDEYLQPRLLAAGRVGHIPELWGSRRVHGGNFYASMYADARRLRTYLELRDALDRHLASFLAQRGERLSSALQARRRAERAEQEFFARRLERDWGGAARALAAAVVARGPRPYAAFKAAALSLAFLSPALHARLLRIYSGASPLAAWRQRLLP